VRARARACVCRNNDIVKNFKKINLAISVKLSFT